MKEGGWRRVQLKVPVTLGTRDSGPHAGWKPAHTRAAADWHF
jgi:hypothetical protein